MRVVLDSGETLDLGETEATPTVGMVDYSRRVTDDYGVTTVVERGFARRMSVRLVVPFDQTDALQASLAAMRAKPARWIADEGVDWLDFRGFFKDFEIDLPVPPKAYCTLTVEALTATEAFADPGGDPAPLGHASTLQLLQPAAIEGGALVTTSVPENDYPEWSADTTYPLGARVIKAATHRIYESGAIGNKGNDPAGVSGKWRDIGPTNRWAMFDQALGSTTTAAGQITVTLAAGAINAVALLDVKAATVRVQAAGYDRTIAPNAAGTVTFLDLPGTGGQVTVTVTGPGTVEVGTLLMGKLVGLGATTDDAKAGITDFSRKETDEFGEIQVVERAWAKRMTLPAKIRRDAIDLVAGRIAAVRAKPSLWIGKEGMETLTVYGFFKDFSIAVDTTICTLSISIEGLSTAGKVEPLIANIPASDVVFEGGETVEDLKPAGPGATDGATVGENIKDPDTGLPVPPQHLLNTLLELRADGTLVAKPFKDGEVAEELGRIRLPDLGAASAASTRQLESALSEVGQAVLQALSEASRSREMFRDAGVFVDPASGEVRISAVEELKGTVSTAEIRLSAAEAMIDLRATRTYVDNAITQAVIDPSQVPVFGKLEVRITEAELRLDGAEAALKLAARATDLNAVGGRVTDAEQRIDALEGEIELKVGTTEFDQLGARVTSAEQTIEAIGDAASISQSVTATRTLTRDVADAWQGTLQNLIDGDLARRQAIVSIANARSELTAKINDDFSAEARARQELAARVGAAEATALTETQLRVEGDLAVALQVTQLGAAVGERFGGFDQAIAALVTADGDIVSGLSQTVSAVRGVSDGADAAADSALRGLLAGDATARDAKAAIAAARQEITAKINGDVEAVAQRVAALLVRMGLSEASIIAEQLVRADAVSALAYEQTRLNADIGSVNARVGREELARATATEALSGRIDTFDADYQENKAQVSATTQALADADDALGSRVDSIKATADGAQAGVEETRLALANAQGKLIAYFRVAATTPDGTTYLEVVQDGATGKIVLGGDVLAKGTVTAEAFVNNAAIVPAFVYTNTTIQGGGWGGGPWDTSGNGNGGVGGGSGTGGSGGGGIIPQLPDQ